MFDNIRCPPTAWFVRARKTLPGEISPNPFLIYDPGKQVNTWFALTGKPEKFFGADVVVITQGEHFRFVDT